MRFARYIFLAAGTVGILVLAPMYFLLEKSGLDNPPPINHQEFYYGFIGVALAFQLVFLMIATDPVKFRPLMLAAIVEKFSFVIPTFYLYWKGRTAGPIVGGAALDLMWGVLFVISYLRVRDRRTRR